MQLTVTRCLGGGATLLLLIGTTACAQHSQAGQPQPASTPAAAAQVQGPVLPPTRVALPNGKKITCPAGAEPTIYLQQASFDPLLQGGTRLGRHDYRITLSGRVVNETNAPVIVTAVQLRVGTSPWKVPIKHPSKLGSGGAGTFTASGVFHNDKSQQAKLAAHLDWKWDDAGLKPCGDKGLIEDD